MSRPRLIAGNWKMNVLQHEAAVLGTEIAHAAAAKPGIDVALFPALTALHTVRAALKDSPVRLGAQACYESDFGAHTGEVSAPMLADAGVTIVLCGHSERRTAGETEDSVGRCVRAVLRTRLRALICVGETLAEREGGATDHVLARQFSAALADVMSPELEAIDLAYEPVWAIGTGRTATPRLASESHALLRKLLVGKFGEAGRSPRILYGGSVKSGNAAELLASPGIDGLLVGGASLEAGQFRSIIEKA